MGGAFLGVVSFGSVSLCPLPPSHMCAQKRDSFCVKDTNLDVLSLWKMEGIFLLLLLCFWEHCCLFLPFCRL